MQSFSLNSQDRLLTYQVLNSAVPRSTLLIASINIVSTRHSLPPPLKIRWTIWCGWTLFHYVVCKPTRFMNLWENFYCSQERVQLSKNYFKVEQIVISTLFFNFYVSCLFTFLVMSAIYLHINRNVSCLYTHISWGY